MRDNPHLLMNRKLFQLLTLVAFVCLSPSAWADGGGEFDCQVPGLIALNPGTPAGLALDFARAQASPLSATVTRDYDFPGSDVRFDSDAVSRHAA